MDWTVYILECADGTLYCGVTNNLERRLSQHNAGKGAKYTMRRSPVRVVYHEPAADRSASQKREAAIKKLTRLQKLDLIKTAA